MNKIYKVIWSKTRNCYVAVAEFVKRNGKGGSVLNRRHIAAALAAVAICAAPAGALANTGGHWDGNDYIGDAPNNVTINEEVNGIAYGRYETDANVDASGATLSIVSGGKVAAAFGSRSSSGDVKGNKVTMTDGETVVRNVIWITVQNYKYQVSGYLFGGFADDGKAEKNTVEISGGTVHGWLTGGYSWDGDAVNNTVTVSGGTASGFVNGGYSKNSDATNNTVTVSGGTVNAAVYGGNSNSGSATSNTVTISGGTVGRFIPSEGVYGGNSNSGSATSNTVTISGGTVKGTVYGGNSDSGSATNNTVTVSDGEVNLVYGGRSDFGSATNNTVTISGGTVKGTVHGGYSPSDTATGNTVTISGGTVNAAVYGGSSDSGSATGNTVTISGGTVKWTVHGGYSPSDTATGNEVIISGGTVNADVYGGYSPSDTATGNTVTISGGTVNDRVSGGNSDSGSATKNTVTISGGEVDWVYGGKSGGGDAKDNTVILSKVAGKEAPVINYTLFGGYSERGGAVSGNTLQVEAVGLSASEIQNFDNYKFVLPSDIKAGDTMLKLKYQLVELEIDGSKVDMAVAKGSGLNIDFGESVTLLHKTLGPGAFSVKNLTGAVQTSKLDGESTGFDVMKYTLDKPDHEDKLNVTVSELHLYGDGGTNTPGQRQTGNTLEIKGGKANVAFGGRATSGDVTGNKVTMSGGELVVGSSTDPYAGNLYGGLAVDGAASGNKVTISGGTLGRFTYVYGGRSEQGAAGGTAAKDGNKVTITGGTVGTVQGGYSLGDASYNSVVIAGGTVQGIAYGGQSTQGNALNNNVTVKNGTVQSNAYGGYTKLTGMKAAGNKVTIIGGTVWDVYGGWVEDTNENGDSVSGSPNPATATENTVEIRGGKVNGDVYGGRSALGSAERNTVILAKEARKNAPNLDNAILYGGFGSSVSDNTLQVEAVGLSALQIMNFDNYKFVLPSDIEAGDTMLKLTGQGTDLTIDGNKVSVTFHELNLKHGESVSLLSVENGQTISGSNLDRLCEQPFQDASPDNSVVLRGTERHRLYVDTGNTRLNYAIDHIAVDTVQLGTTDWQKNAVLLHGTSDAYLYDKVTVLDTAKFAMRFAKPETVAVGDSMTLLAANDTLRDMAAETKQNAYQFTPVAGVTVDAAITGSLAAKSGNVTYTVDENRAGKLTFGNVQWKDSGALLKRPGNITFARAEVDTQKIHFTNVEQLKANQKMTLVSDFGNSVGTITGDHYTVGTTLHGKGKASLQGSDLIYTVETGTHKHDPDPVPEVQPQTHNVLMAMTAGMQMVKQGGDFMDKAASGLGASENTDADGSSVFAAVGGGAGRTETGSHVKTHTWNGIVAVGDSRKIESGTFQWGVFGEYGKGNYSLHNDTGRGDGDAHYAGGGLLAKWTNKHDVYTEVGVRLGRMSDKASDLLEDADGNRYGYDIHTNYYGAHLGFGKVFRYKGGRSLDVYGKYFYTKRDGADFEAGGHYSLDSVKSSVLRVGARYGTSDKRWNWYGGLAYEYEFDGKSTGTADGRPIRAASIKGGSVRGEVGLRMEATQKNPWQADISLTGYAGRHRGFGGNVSVAYTF